MKIHGVQSLRCFSAFLKTAAFLYEGPEFDTYPLYLGLRMGMRGYRRVNEYMRGCPCGLSIKFFIPKWADPYDKIGSGGGRNPCKIIEF